MTTEAGLLADVAVDGYATVPLLGGSELRRLGEAFTAVRPTSLDGFWSNVTGGATVAENHRVRDVVLEVMWPAVSSLLPGWRPAYTSFVAKGRGRGTEAKPHQDWSMVDEGHAQALNVWVPLVDADRANGMIEVVPGSHLRSWEVRSLTLPSPCLEFGGPVEDHLRAVPLLAGEALLYPHDLFHGSRANLTNRDRPAVALSVLPGDARFVQYYAGQGTPPGLVDVYAVDDEYFYRDLPSLLDGGRPFRHALLGQVDRGPAPLSPDAALRRLADPAAGASRPSRADPTSPPPDDTRSTPRT